MRGVLAAVIAALGAGLWAAPAHADQTVVVDGTSFPGSGTYLTYFGCGDLYHADTRGPQVRITRDDAAPSGRRATRLDMPGLGTASGPVSLVESVADATSAVSVKASSGSAGVAYVWFVSPELSAGQVWAGRAVLSAAAGGWQHVDATAPTYRWTRYDAATGTVLGRPGAATIDDFTADHGDGPGYLLSGFGCDGRPFALDGLQVGTPGDVTTFDLEGWQVDTTITVPARTVAPGEEVRVLGRSEDTRGRAMGAPLQLEARPGGAAEFEPVGDPVEARPDGDVVTTVTPEVTTAYRWVFAETGYADGHHSPAAVVEVDPAATPDPQQPTASGDPGVPGTEVSTGVTPTTGADPGTSGEEGTASDGAGQAPASSAPPPPPSSPEAPSPTPTPPSGPTGATEPTEPTAPEQADSGLPAVTATPPPVGDDPTGAASTASSAGAAAGG